MPSEEMKRRMAALAAQMGGGDKPEQVEASEQAAAAAALEVSDAPAKRDPKKSRVFQHVVANSPIDASLINRELMERFGEDVDDDDLDEAVTADNAAALAARIFHFPTIVPDTTATGEPTGKYKIYIPSQLFTVIDNPDGDGSVVSFRADDFEHPSFPSGQIPYRWLGAGTPPKEIHEYLQDAYQAIEAEVNEDYMQAIQAGRIALPAGVTFEKLGPGHYAYFKDGEPLGMEGTKEDVDLFLDCLEAQTDYFNDLINKHPPQGDLWQYYQKKHGTDPSKWADQKAAAAFANVTVAYYGFKNPKHLYRTIFQPAPAAAASAANVESTANAAVTITRRTATVEKKRPARNGDDDGNDDQTAKQNRDGTGGKRGRGKGGPAKGRPVAMGGGSEEFRVDKPERDPRGTGHHVNHFTKAWFDANRDKVQIKPMRIEDIIAQPDNDMNLEFQLWGRLSTETRNKICWAYNEHVVNKLIDGTYDEARDLPQALAAIDAAITGEVEIRTRAHQHYELAERRKAKADGVEREPNVDPKTVIPRDDVLAIVRNAVEQQAKQELAKRQAQVAEADAGAPARDIHIGPKPQAAAQEDVDGMSVQDKLSLFRRKQQAAAAPQERREGNPDKAAKFRKKQTPAAQAPTETDEERAAKAERIERGKRGVAALKNKGAQVDREAADDAARLQAEEDARQDAAAEKREISPGVKAAQAKLAAKLGGGDSRKTGAAGGAAKKTQAADATSSNDNQDDVTATTGGGLSVAERARRLQEEQAAKRAAAASSTTDNEMGVQNHTPANAGGAPPPPPAPPPPKSGRK